MPLALLNKRILALSSFLLIGATSFAQIEGLTDETKYTVEMNGSFSSGNQAPFWFSANKYGLSTIEPNSGYLRASIYRDTETDSLLEWRYGYGLDVAVPVQYTSPFVIHQAYGIVQYKNAQLIIGAKETPSEMLNQELSSGGATLSGNYRPIPQVKFDLPNWWVWHFTNDWVAVKGHISYGLYTDWNWQEDFVAPGNIYTKKSRFHSKSGFVKIGREDVFPLSATLGLQMATQFGGYGYNIKDRNDVETYFNDVDLGNGLKSYWNAFIPGGNDVNDGDYNNVEGNHTGNWYFDLTYKGKDWSVKAYAEHFFEDHSQMFVEYGWKDMLWGIEAELPKNPFVSNIVAEYLYTKDQTGGLYHDSSELFPVQISGKDDYYNHHVYGAWQHWGQAMGNPLLLSPIYNTNGMLGFMYNRLYALHFGISGNPNDEIRYKILYSHLNTLGTYDRPTVDPVSQTYFLAEVGYAPKKLKGWSTTLSFGLNDGDLLDKSTGFGITIKKMGKLL